MKNLEAIALESTRLLLRPISLNYAEIIFQEFTAKITLYMYPKPAENINETLQFIRDATQKQINGTDVSLVILKKDSQEFLGVCGVHRLNTTTPELGIWTKQSAHGHSYGREAIHCLKTWIDQTLEYDYLVYPVDKRNIPSQKIPQSLGGKPFQEYSCRNLSGNNLDLIEYRIYHSS